MAAAPQHTYSIIVANPAFPHAFGQVLETDVTTETNAILVALKLWRKGNLPVMCIEEFLDLTAPDFVRECYENPSGLEEGEEDVDSEASSAAGSAAGSAADAPEAAEGGGEAMETTEEDDEFVLSSPWVPQAMARPLTRKIALKVKELIASKDLRAIFLRMLERQSTPVLLIMPTAATHMNTLLHIIKCLSAVPSGGGEDDI